MQVEPADCEPQVQFSTRPFLVWLKMVFILFYFIFSIIIIFIFLEGWEEEEERK